MQQVNLRIQGQNERRQRVMERQQRSRREAIERARTIAQMEEKSKEKKTKKQRIWQHRFSNLEKFYAEQFQIPEWMIQIPQDLGADHWYVLPKPEGERCLVISGNGSTVSRKKQGNILHKFNSFLPNGSKSAVRTNDGYSMLECIYDEALRTYFIVDMLIWKGYSIFDLTAEFRFFWIQSKISEIPDITTAQPEHHEYRMVLLPTFDCSKQGFFEAYSNQFHFNKAGLLFYYKNGLYHPGLTPFVLGWKDARISRFPIDSPDGINPYPIQECTLLLKSITPNIVLCALGGDRVHVNEIVDLPQPECQTGVIRFEIHGKIQILNSDEKMDVSSGDFDDTTDVRIAIERLVYRKHESGDPQSSCRIAFQYAMRYGPLTPESISNHIVS